jgi:hypothetical protein
MAKQAKKEQFEIPPPFLIPIHKDYQKPGKR